MAPFGQLPTRSKLATGINLLERSMHTNSTCAATWPTTCLTTGLLVCRLPRVAAEASRSHGYGQPHGPLKLKTHSYGQPHGPLKLKKHSYGQPHGPLKLHNPCLTAR